jgi:hypothetical protein
MPTGTSAGSVAVLTCKVIVTVEPHGASAAIEPTKAVALAWLAPTATSA